jgi:uncharacterized protein (UPF0261 family)
VVILSKTIAIVASLDTKSREVEFARDLIQRMGHATLVIDVSVRHEPTIIPDITSQEVLGFSGVAWGELLQKDKSKRIELMAQAITAILPALYEQGKFDAVFSMGGLQNTTMATKAMQVLPWGVPKVMLTTIANGNRCFGPYVGTKDMLIMHSVADIAGINFVTQNVISNAIAAVVGMAQMASGRVVKQDKNIIGATMLGITGGGVVEAIRLLEERGHDVVTFHANGVGGRSLEEMIELGMVNAVLDMTLNELTGEILGGFASDAKGRLEAATKAGIPQVIVPGALDVVTFTTAQAGVIPPQAVTREKKFFHNSTLVHTKVTETEMVQIASLIAERLNQGKGPATVLIPCRGFSEPGGPGGPLFGRTVDDALAVTLRKKCDKRIRIIEADYNINDAEFAKLAADYLLEYLS